MALEEVARVAAMLRGRPPAASLDERRARFERTAEAFPLPADLAFHEMPLGSAAGLQVTTPETLPGRTVLWLHGGAFVLGSSRSYRHWAGRLARASRARVVLLDYRLAPEHPFPAALDDVHAALEVLADGSLLAVGGDSAGANLAAAALAHRDVQGVSAAILVSGYFDLTHSGASVATRAARDPFVDVATMPATAATYLAGAAPHASHASPLFAPLSGFPPTLVQVGSEEALFDDSLRFAEALRAGGVTVVFQEWAGMIHAWPFFCELIEEGRWAIDQAGAFLRGVWQDQP